MRCIKTIFIISLMILLASLNGCVNQKGFYNETTDEIITPAAYEQLTAEQQAAFVAIEYKQVDPDIQSKVQSGIDTGSGVLTVVKPLIPEPIATGLVALLGGLAYMWKTFSTKKTIDTLDRIKEGALITSASIDKVVRPAADIMDAFKAEQKLASSNTKAIMPDKIL